MHAGNGDAVFEAHELGEHFGTLNDGDFVGVGFEDLGIHGIDGGACDDHSGPGDVAGVVAFIDGGAEVGEAVSDGAAAQIGAGDLYAEVQQDLGNAAHPDSTDADEVRVLGGCKHGGRNSTVAPGGAEFGSEMDAVDP